MQAAPSFQEMAKRHPRRNRRAPLRAGRSRRTPGCWSSGSSPSKPTGSIAGSVAPSGSDSGSGVIPVETDGLHCGRTTGVTITGRKPGHPRRNRRAPLRGPRPAGRGCVRLRVIPVETDGLHCGQRRAGLRRRSCRVIPVGTDGLHCGNLSVASEATAACRHPRRNRRAPLRAQLVRLQPRLSRQSSPSKPTGSIAGRDCGGELRERRGHVIPVETDGLHCGELPPGDRPGGADGHPRRNRRAPLRAGSVDAGRVRDSGHPRRNRRAPLRDHSPRGPVVAASWSSPSKPTGSIAGPYTCAGFSGSIPTSSPSKPTGSIAGAQEAPCGHEKP